MQNNGNVMTEISNYVQRLEVKKQKEDFFFFLCLHANKGEQIPRYLYPKGKKCESNPK